MNKKRVAIAMCAIALITGALAVARQSQTGNSSPQQNASAAIPQQVVYRQLFRQIAFFKQKAEEKERQSQDGTSLRTFHKRQAKLDDKQAQSLDRIATDCDREVGKLDAKAKKIIDDARAPYPDGKIKKGQALPSPPEELKAMQKQRDDIILQARDQLRVAFGDTEFARFEEYVQKNIASQIKPIAIDRPRPDIPGVPRQQGQQQPHK